MRIILIVIGLFFLAPLAFADPVYIEKKNYKVEVEEDGKIFVEQINRVFKDGVEISKTLHRHPLDPGTDIINEVQKVKDIANVVWTSEVIKEYEAEKAEREKDK